MSVYGPQLLEELKNLKEFWPYRAIFRFHNPLNFGPRTNAYTGKYDTSSIGSICFDSVVIEKNNLRGRPKKELINNKRGGQSARDRMAQLIEISLDSSNLLIFIRFLQETIKKERNTRMVESILENIKINSVIDNKDRESFLECDVEEKNAEIIKLLLDKPMMFYDFSSIMPANFFSCE